MKQQNQAQDYKKIKLLGQGTYGKAFLVERKSDGLKCVIKQIEMSHMTEEERKEAQKEANILQMLNHHNIIKYHEQYKTKKGRLCIVMDYAEEKLVKNNRIKTNFSHIFTHFNLKRTSFKIKNVLIASNTLHICGNFSIEFSLILKKLHILQQQFPTLIKVASLPFAYSLI
ncbi:kinase domain protein (macronuclear) [Tetrahymena thermophila SB210]|uniref:non-specific serine/threonine protein kinase n=1 Tax=Tetrahymena thermophila (strain SB210) TaxID=312017 RepID=Q22Z70_TETTS|nr:kinase domain protein [Tetrahymena thermophila SB210]EAR90451.2 kinase domain protein [Tetrahymena thermophila SB210]|eukprot:XP_001010696.2 kinase domain protein [Tetrahymena thermophila SB210]